MLEELTKNEKKLNCLLAILQKTRQFLQDNPEKEEVRSVLQAIEKKIAKPTPPCLDLTTEPDKENDQVE